MAYLPKELVSLIPHPVVFEHVFFLTGSLPIHLYLFPTAFTSS